MRGLALPVLLVPLVLLGAPATAKAADPADIEPTGQRNAAYLDAVRGMGLQTEVIYLRPAVAFDPRTHAGRTPPEPPRAPDPETVRTIWGLVFGALLIGTLIFAAWFGGRIPVSFRARGGDKRRRGTGAEEDAAVAPDLPADAFLERLRGMADRRAALILLTGRALETAADANGLRIGRAQTARDVLRAVPRRWPHFETLRGLVREAEVVHFGGRDLPEARWRACLDAALPLLRPGLGRGRAG